MHLVLQLFHVVLEILVLRMQLGVLGCLGVELLLDLFPLLKKQANHRLVLLALALKTIAFLYVIVELDMNVISIIIELAHGVRGVLAHLKILIF